MPGRTRPIDPDEVRELRELLRRTGVRATPARIAVLRELRGSRSPLTHAELAGRLVPIGFDKATIFRNLSDLADAGLVVRAELGDHVWRFEAADPEHPVSEKHPHFVCTDCGGVTCLEAMSFTSDSRRRAKVIGKITEVLIKGRCATCEGSPA